MPECNIENTQFSLRHCTAQCLLTYFYSLVAARSQRSAMYARYTPLHTGRLQLPNQAGVALRGPVAYSVATARLDLAMARLKPALPFWDQSSRAESKPVNAVMT